MATQGLLRIRHERRDIGFLRARLNRDGSDLAGWNLRIESPAELDEFRDHLVSGTCMALTMVTRDGDRLYGEACVADISDGLDSASLVTLSGMGPLQKT